MLKLNKIVTVMESIRVKAANIVEYTRGCPYAKGISTIGKESKILKFLKMPKAAP